jgi:hypothetical protein
VPTIYEQLDRLALSGREDPEPLPAPENAVAGFQAIYKDPRRPWAERKWAMQQAAPYESPRLGTTNTNISIGFAASLEELHNRRRGVPRAPVTIEGSINKDVDES